DAERPELVEDDTLADEAAWVQANPGLDIRISREAVADELRALDRRTFAVERLGVGDWPPTSDEHETVIPLEQWNALIDETSGLIDPVFFAYDVSPDRAMAAIAAAGRRRDGRFHLEVVQHRRGTGWVVAALAGFRAGWAPPAILGALAGPAGALAHRCEDAGFSIDPVTAADNAKACGVLVDLAVNEQLRHLGSSELTAALKGATTRPLGDSWAWSRKNSAVDSPPRVAATRALGGASTLGWDPDEAPTIW